MDIEARLRALEASMWSYKVRVTYCDGHPAQIVEVGKCLSDHAARKRAKLMTGASSASIVSKS
jgi:hypothetical protein